MINDKKVRKISDFPKIQTLTNEYQPIIRKVNGKWSWVRGAISDVLSYKRNFPFVDSSVFIKETSGLLRAHLESSAPHLMEDRDSLEIKNYSLSLNEDGVLTISFGEEAEEFIYNSSEDFLDFRNIFNRHLEEDFEFHKVFDKRDSSWVWYKVNFEEENDGPMFIFEFLDFPENTLDTDSIENQELDYLHNVHILNKHKESLFPHKVLNLNLNFGFIKEDGEIHIVLGD